MSARAHTAPAPIAGITAAREADATADGAVDTVLCALLAVYLTTLAFEGLLRWGLVEAGAPNALYLRDAIPILTVAVLLFRSMAGNRLDLGVAIPVAILIFHAAWSAMVGVALFSVAFGLKIFMFIPYGIAMWPLVRRRLGLALNLASAMFVVTVAGVFLNFHAGQLPWEGLEYETAFGAVTTTRMWWITEGTPRVPGFTRTSFNAAMILGLTGVLAMVRFRSAVVRLAIAAAGFAGIVMTTSKGMVIAFPLAAAWLLLQSYREQMRGAALVAFLCAATVTLPLVIVFFDLGAAMSASSFPWFLVSVWQRFTEMWPQAFMLLPDGPQAFLGGGLGSIGTPQMYGESPDEFNAADNLAVFMLVNFGVPGLLYYAFPALSVHRMVQTTTATEHRTCVAVLLIAYGYGMSINMVEESFFCVLFGLCCGAAISAWQQPVLSDGSARERPW